MKKQKLTIKTIIFFLSGILFFAYNLKAQQTQIVSNSGNISGTVSSNGVWENVGASVDISISTGECKVLVLSTFEANISKGNTSFLCSYQITDGTSDSPIIERYVTTKDYDDHGLGAIGNIFTYDDGPGDKNFNLQHIKYENPSRQVTTEGVLVALVINDANVQLPNSHKKTGDVETESTDYVEVTGTKTDDILLKKSGGIYLTTSFSTFGSGALEGSYVLRSSTTGDAGSYTNIPNTEITRSNSTNPGAATISILLENQPAGTYYFDVAHKTSTGTLTTKNLTLNVVGLVDSEGLVFQTFSNSGRIGLNLTDSFKPVNSNTITSLNSDNKVFLHSTFNMTSVANTVTAAFQLDVTGGASFTSQVLERYVPAGGTGSGGIIGLATGLSISADYTCELQHRSTSGILLKTHNSNLVGFQLTSSPDGVTVNSSTYEFTASNSNYWNDAGNWDIGSIPGATNDVNIPSDMTAIIEADKSASCNNLDVDGSLTINSSASSTGSLIVNFSTGGAGTINVQRYLPSSNWHIVSSPVGGQQFNNFGITNGLTINNNKYPIGTYDESNDNWAYKSTTDINTFNSAKGYSILSPGVGVVTFSGTSINVGDQAIDITRSNYGWNAIGNPYTSAILAKGTNSFLAANSGSLDDTYVGMYVWDGETAGDYKVISNGLGSWPGGEDELVQNNIAVGQGFIIKAKAGGETLNFTSAMQVHATATPFKSAEKYTPAVRLTVTSGDLVNRTIVSFDEESTKGLDPGYDVGKLKGNPNIALYTELVDKSSDVDFMYQSLPDVNYELLAVPIGLDLKNGNEITFSLETSTGFDDNMNVYLEDKELNITTQLDVTDSKYSVTVPSLKGYGRFNLYFTNSTTDIDTDLLAQPKFNVFTRDKLIFVNGNTDNNTRFTVYGIDGKMWYKNRAEATNQNTIDASGFAPGVYLIKIDKQSGSQVLKVIITE